MYTYTECTCRASARARPSAVGRQTGVGKTRKQLFELIELTCSTIRYFRSLAPCVHICQRQHAPVVAAASRRASRPRYLALLLC